MIDLLSVSLALSLSSASLALCISLKFQNTPKNAKSNVNMFGSLDTFCVVSMLVANKISIIRRYFEVATLSLARAL